MVKLSNPSCWSSRCVFIPEQYTFALMLGGLGLITTKIRRSKRLRPQKPWSFGGTGSLCGWCCAFLRCELKLPPSSVRAPARESNKQDFKVQCPLMESNFCPLWVYSCAWSRSSKAKFQLISDLTKRIKDGTFWVWNRYWTQVSSDQTVAMSLYANGLKLCLLQSEESWVKISKQFNLVGHWACLWLGI